MKVLYRLLLIFIALHLVFSNTDLLISAAEMALQSKLNGIEKAFRVIFSLSYSLITVLVIHLYPRMWMIILLSVFDGFAVYLKYNVFQDNFIVVTSIYFGLYTMVIILAGGLVRKYVGVGKVTTRKKRLTIIKN